MINFWTMKTLECLIYQGMVSELVYWWADLMIIPGLY